MLFMFDVWLSEWPFSLTFLVWPWWAKKPNEDFSDVTLVFGDGELEGKNEYE